MRPGDIFRMRPRARPAKRLYWRRIVRRSTTTGVLSHGASVGRLLCRLAGRCHRQATSCRIYLQRLANVPWIASTYAPESHSRSAPTARP